MYGAIHVNPSGTANARTANIITQTANVFPINVLNLINAFTYMTPCIYFFIV